MKKIYFIMALGLATLSGCSDFLDQNNIEDNMAKTEKGYFSSLAYPSTTLKMLSEIATKCKRFTF